MNRARNQYKLPVPADVILYRVDQTSSGSHEGAHRGSVDFAVPLGTVVLAAADGVVTRVRVDSDKHGETIAFGKDANYITIEHEQGELSEYLHLAQDSASVRVGDHVRAEQQIAVTGLSGWMYAPHLHFMVYRKDGPFQCLQVDFTGDKAE